MPLLKEESWVTFGQLTRLLFKCVRVAAGKICFQRKGCLGEQDLQRETQAAGLSLLTLGGLNTQSVLALSACPCPVAALSALPEEPDQQRNCCAGFQHLSEVTVATQNC